MYIITEPEGDIWAASVSKVKAGLPTAKAALEHLLLFTTAMRRLRIRLRSLGRLDQPTRETYGPKPSGNPYLGREIATMVELKVGYNLDWKDIEPVLPPRSSKALGSKFKQLELDHFFEGWGESEEDAFRKVLHNIVRDKQWKPWQIDWDQVALRFPNKKWLHCLWLAHKLKCPEVGHRTQKGEDSFSTQASQNHGKSLNAAAMSGPNASVVAISAQPWPVAGTAGFQKPTSASEFAPLFDDSVATDLDAFAFDDWLSRQAIPVMDGVAESSVAASASGPSASMSGVDTSEAAEGDFDPSKALGAFDPSTITDLTSMWPQVTGEMIECEVENEHRQRMIRASCNHMMTGSGSHYRQSTGIDS